MAARVLLHFHNQRVTAVERANVVASLGGMARNQGDDGIAVVILTASALVYARLDASKKGLDAGLFVERRQRDAMLSKRIPKKMIGRRLSQDEAKSLLKKL